MGVHINNLLGIVPSTLEPLQQVSSRTPPLLVMSGLPCPTRRPSGALLGWTPLQRGLQRHVVHELRPGWRSARRATCDHPIQPHKLESVTTLHHDALESGILDGAGVLVGADLRPQFRPSKESGQVISPEGTAWGDVGTLVLPIGWKKRT